MRTYFGGEVGSRDLERNICQLIILPKEYARDTMTFEFEHCLFVSDRM